jgi:hypothetical protein
VEEEWENATVILIPGCQVREWGLAGGMLLAGAEGTEIVFLPECIQVE